MKHFFLLLILLAALFGVAQQSPQPQPDGQSAHLGPKINLEPEPSSQALSQDSRTGTQNSDTCLICRPCPTSSDDNQPSATCLLCKACSQTQSTAGTATSAPEEKPPVPSVPAAPDVAVSAKVHTQQVNQPVAPVAPAAIVAKNDAPHDWRTHSGALDLHFETGGVFNGPSIAVCDINTYTCSDSGKTHLAGNLGATYWMTPMFGLSLDTVLMDGGTIAGVTENSIGAYLGLQLQKPSGAVRPYLELAPGYIHSFTTGDSGTVQFNPDLASMKAGGGIRCMVGRHWGVKLGVDALPSFSGLGHQTPITATVGWFWQSKGRGSTK